MRRAGIGVAGGFAVSLAVLAAGCAHENGNAAAEARGGVRMAATEQDVQGCEKISEVRVNGTWTKGAARTELQNLTKSKGGNVLLMSSKDTSSGYAYRCTGGTAVSAK